MSESLHVTGRYSLNRLFLLYALFSFFGWVFEVIVLFTETGRYVDRGFLSLPLCPIYGTAIVGCYLLLGVPQSAGGILRGVSRPSVRVAVYCLTCFLLPTLIELTVGVAFDKGMGLTLWSYDGFPLNIGGYICLPVSIVWGTGLFLLMRFCFLPLKRAVERLPRWIVIPGSIVLALLMGIDFIQMIRLSV